MTSNWHQQQRYGSMEQKNDPQLSLSGWWANNESPFQLFITSNEDIWGTKQHNFLLTLGSFTLNFIFSQNIYLIWLVWKLLQPIRTYPSHIIYVVLLLPTIFCPILFLIFFPFGVASITPHAGHVIVFPFLFLNPVSVTIQ